MYLIATKDIKEGTLLGWVDYSTLPPTVKFEDHFVRIEPEDD